MRPRTALTLVLAGLLALPALASPPTDADIRQWFKDVNAAQEAFSKSSDTSQAAYWKMWRDKPARTVPARWRADARGRVGRAGEPGALGWELFGARLLAGVPQRRFVPPVRPLRREQHDDLRGHALLRAE